MIYSLWGMCHPTLYIEYHTSYAPWISVSKPISYLGLTSIIVPDPSCNTVQIKSNPFGWIPYAQKKAGVKLHLKRHLFALCFWSTVLSPPQKKTHLPARLPKKNRMVFQRSNVRIWTPSFKKESLPKRTLEKSTFMAVVKMGNHFPQLFGINKPGPNMLKMGTWYFLGRRREGIEEKNMQIRAGSAQL